MYVWWPTAYQHKRENSFSSFQCTIPDIMISSTQNRRKLKNAVPLSLTCSERSPSATFKTASQMNTGSLNPDEWFLLCIFISDTENFIIIVIHYSLLFKFQSRIFQILVIIINTPPGQVRSSTHKCSWNSPTNLERPENICLSSVWCVVQMKLRV